MQILRFIAAVGNACLLLFMLYLLAFVKGGEGDKPLVAGIAVLSALNIFYLLACPPHMKTPTSSIGRTRIGRLLSLWLDAKESELRDRAKPKNSN